MTVHIPTNVKDPDRIRERRAQIIRAAVALFAEKGYHRATTRELAKHSGLSNGALYEYVNSKEDILYLVCQHIHSELQARLAESRSRGVSAADRLRDALYALFRVIRDMQDEVLLIYQESKSLPPSFLHDVLGHEQAIVSVFEELLRAGCEDGSLCLSADEVPLVAQDIVVLAQMWAFRRWALQSVPFEQFAAQQADVILRACTRTAP
ncbi:MAG: TetR/AcrR family transcriptional regulator [Alicyclobacillus sp.]|nr:TetR/AcrR family transcriptional regulator [Alicyclobacillus sp.]